MAADFTSFTDLLKAMLARAQNPIQLLREVGLFIVGEMKQNIEAGGRPDQWPESIRVQRNGGQTLRNSGALYNSIVYDVPDNQSVIVGPGGISEKYARIQNEGGTITAKNVPYLKFFIPGVGWIQKKSVVIPARQYTNISDAAQKTFAQILQQGIVGT